MSEYTYDKNLMKERVSIENSQNILHIEHTKISN